MLARLTAVGDSVQMFLMRRSLVLAVAVLLILVCLEGEGRAQPTHTPGCTIVWVTAPIPPGKPFYFRRPLDFVAPHVLDLQFWVILPSASATPGRSLEVKLFTPKGHLYQTLSAPIVHGARPRLFQTVTLRLPVAGSTIVNNSLYGIWTAEAYLGGDTSPCTWPRKFRIRS
jgi:hypothetical protein